MVLIFFGESCADRLTAMVVGIANANGQANVCYQNTNQVGDV
jgi:hypothetical protein